MKKLFIEQTPATPEINFSPAENIFMIRGTSSPEDVRAMYYPVIEWVKIFVDDVIDGEYKIFDSKNPVRLQIDLLYFNSSSAKFLFDLLIEMQRLKPIGVPFEVIWLYDQEDPDMKEAGVDFAKLAEIDFTFIAKSKETDEGSEGTL